VIAVMQDTSVIPAALPKDWTWSPMTMPSCYCPDLSGIVPGKE
jgi:hypothetical protein